MVSAGGAMETLGMVLAEGALIAAAASTVTTAAAGTGKQTREVRVRQEGRIGTVEV